MREVARDPPRVREPVPARALDAHRRERRALLLEQVDRHRELAALPRLVRRARERAEGALRLPRAEPVGRPALRRRVLSVEPLEDVRAGAVVRRRAALPRLHREQVLAQARLREGPVALAPREQAAHARVSGRASAS